MTEYDWIIGIALMFGLALVLNKLTFESMPSFIIFLTIFNAFVVYGNLLPLWSLVLNIVILSIVMYIEMNNKRGIE